MSHHRCRAAGFCGRRSDRTTLRPRFPRDASERSKVLRHGLHSLACRRRPDHAICLARRLSRCRTPTRYSPPVRPRPCARYARSAPWAGVIVLVITSLGTGVAVFQVREQCFPALLRRTDGLRAAHRLVEPVGAVVEDVRVHLVGQARRVGPGGAAGIRFPSTGRAGWKRSYSRTASPLSSVMSGCDTSSTTRSGTSPRSRSRRPCVDGRGRRRPRTAGAIRSRRSRWCAGPRTTGSPCRRACPSPARGCRPGVPASRGRCAGSAAAKMNSREAPAAGGHSRATASTVAASTKEASRVGWGWVRP